MKTGLVALLIGLAAVSPAHADFLTYFKWERLSENGRAGYIAGAMDSYMTFSGVDPDYSKTADHIADCLVRTDMNNSQLAAKVLAFATGRPAEQSQPVPGIMIRYLIELCGLPPSN